MNCKNCGAKLSENAKVCKNCGAFVDDESGYTLLAADDRYADVYSSGARQKSRKGLAVFLVIVLLLLIGSGSYVYFTQIRPHHHTAPKLTFVTGAGLINRNERVFYVSLPKGADIEYIHGVSLYDYDKTEKDEKRQPVSTDYEYTKNIDDSFRLIYFYTKPLKLDKTKEYTYTFEMKFSFRGDDGIYTYLQPITFKANAKDDASDIVFDHSLNEVSDNAGTQEPTSGADVSTTLPQDETAFINDGYWYTSPNTDGSVRRISAFRFGTDNTYSVTNYEKNGDEDWVVNAEEGTYSIKNNTIVLDDHTEFTIDTENQTVYEAQDGQKTQTLTHRNYNSVANSEDFFGI